MATERSVSAKNYTGKYSKFWDYRNQDGGGIHANSCCGQAAVYSAMMTMKVPGLSKVSFRSFVEGNPPDQFGGSLGSSWQLIVSMLQRYQLKVSNYRGESELRKHVKNGPVVVCLDVGAAGWGKWGLHWVSVFGLANGKVYLNNWQANGEGGEFWCTLDNFLKGWNTMLTNMISGTTNWCFVPTK